MKVLRYFFLIIITLLLALLLTACASAQPGKAVLQLENMRFVQSELHVSTGQPVTLHIMNTDGYTHAFDLDEFNVHAPLAANETVDVIFAPDKPGRYTFYCGAPGHLMAGMVGTLVVEP